MPTLAGAWRALCRLIARIDAALTVDPETEWGDSVQRGNGPADVPRTGNSRLHGYYERVREQEQIRRDRRAKRRALTLLLKLLSPQQRQEFREFRHFHVTGGRSGNRYRVRAATFANIDVLYANGRVKHRLCAHPTGDVPVYDVMAAQMLHLQDPVTEQRFLQRANVHPALSEDCLHSRPAWMA